MYKLPHPCGVFELLKGVGGWVETESLTMKLKADLLFCSGSFTL